MANAWPSAIVIGVLASCSSAPPGAEPRPAPPAVVEASAGEPVVYEESSGWDEGAGCTPRGDELKLVGTLIVRPFGKGTDGAMVETDAGEWILTYRAEGAVLALQGKRVLVRGRACDKQGASIRGNHLELVSITEPVPAT